MDLTEFITSNEISVRLAFFFGVLGIMAMWEIITPRRELSVSKGIRWMNNLGVVVLNTVILRLIFPAAAVGMAALAETQNWGLLNYLQILKQPVFLPKMLSVPPRFRLQNPIWHNQTAGIS